MTAPMAHVKGRRRMRCLLLAVTALVVAVSAATVTYSATTEQTRAGSWYREHVTATYAAGRIAYLHCANFYDDQDTGMRNGDCWTQFRVDGRWHLVLAGVEHTPGEDDFAELGR